MEMAEIVMNPVRQRIFQYFLLLSLLSICASFARYFSSGNADPKKDMLLFTNCTLVLTDEEFSGFLSEINEIALKYMKVEATESSKTRQITLISAPVDGR